MDEARFRALVEAYGAAPHRWPAEERASAAAFAGTAVGAAVLARASRLDRALAAQRVPAPSAPLAARILSAGLRRSARRARLRRLLLGAGLIGLGAAGGLTGALAVTVVGPGEAIHGEETTTAFGQLRSDADMAGELP